MPDFALPWGGDLQLSPSGGVELFSGSALTLQRLIRRFLTNPGDDIHEPDYGAGLRRFIGKPMHEASLAALVREQAMMESTVASVLSVTVSDAGVSSYVLTVVYIETSDPGTPQILTLPVS